MEGGIRGSGEGKSKKAHQEGGKRVENHCHKHVGSGVTAAKRNMEGERGVEKKREEGSYQRTHPFVYRKKRGMDADGGSRADDAGEATSKLNRKKKGRGGGVGFLSLLEKLKENRRGRKGKNQ